MTFAYKAVLEGDKELRALLAELPDRVQNRVFRFAGRKVGDAVAKGAMQILRTELKPHLDIMGPMPYRALRDSYINKQVIYRASKTTVNIIGGQTGRMGNNRVNHLVEDGTGHRYTKYKTQYARTTPRLIMRNRRVQLADGRWKTIKEQHKTSNKKSIGSFPTAVWNVAYRGQMPAFHQLRRAVDQTPVEQIWDSEVSKGLQRIMDRAAKAG